MNKKLLAATLGLAFAAPAFADSSSVVLYGRLHQALELNSVDTGVAGGDRTSDMNLAGYSSRIGVNVKEDLGGGLSFIGGYEWGTNVEAAGNTIAGRNAFVGMAGGFGRVTAGIQDGGNGTVAPLYVQASKYHLNGQNNAGSLTNIGSEDFTGASSAAGNPNATNGVINRKQRADNSLGYAGSFGGLNVTARHSMAGANQAAGVATGTENDVTLSEAAVDYKIGNLEIGGGVATYRYEAPEPAGSIDNVYQLGGKYTFGALSIAGLYGSSSFNGANQADRDDFGVSAEYKLTANAGITASYGDAELAGRRDANQAQVIGYYDFSKRTRAYAGLSRTTFDNANAAGTSNGTETDLQSVVMGLRHNF